jgi:hypothetical protein
MPGELAASLVDDLISFSSLKMCLALYAGERGGDLDNGARTAAMMAAARAIDEEEEPGSELDETRAGSGSRPRGGKAELLGAFTPPKRVPSDPSRL